MGLKLRMASCSLEVLALLLELHGYSVDPSPSLSKAQSQFLEHRVETEEDTVLEVRVASDSQCPSGSVVAACRRQASADGVEEQSMGAAR